MNEKYDGLQLWGHTTSEFRICQVSYLLSGILNTVHNRWNHK